MNPLKFFLKYKNFTMSHRLNVNNNKLLSSMKTHCSYCRQAFNQEFQLNEDDAFYSKIIYNEVIKKTQVTIKKTEEPIFLKYLTQKIDAESKEKVEEPEIVNFPFAVREEVLQGLSENDVTADSNTMVEGEEAEQGEWKFYNYRIDKANVENPERWKMTSDYGDAEDYVFEFGTCDPSKPVSKIPCGGCGAFLHCNDASIPGFLPKEVFGTLKKEKLLGQICQRCHFLKKFNVALGVNIPPSQYEQIIGSIKSKTGLVIFLIDLLDFPCSIYPEVFNLIGQTKPIVVVGNKIDLLMQEDPMFLENIKKSLLSSLREKKFNIKNIKHVALISAKTGYGVEELITTLQENWGNQGDVYLVGCTNVGKSSLFNTFIQSDYCKVNATDILQRATVSPWPGTTLNLLKFPISKVLSWRLAARRNRLMKEEEQKLAIQRIQFMNQTIRFQQIPLADHVGRTFRSKKTENVNEADQLEKQEENETVKGFNPRQREFIFSKWFYDTPGVVHEDQILNLLTTSELLLTLPTKMLVPRNFLMTPGHTVFIGGLARLDYLSGPKTVWFTVFASHNLPVTVTKVEDAALVYQKLLGSPLFCVPSQGKKRLSKWPNLASKKIEIYGKLPRQADLKDDNFRGKAPKEADADIVLTSAGWVSVTVAPPYRCILEAWTPEGRGIHVRSVPIIKRGHTFRGSRIENTPAYESVVKEVRGYSITDEPPF